MTEVRIQKVSTRYRLPRSLRAEQGRLDQLTRQVIEEACAETFEHLGLAEESELCLRNVFVPVSLRLNRADKSLVDHWSKALAREIATAVRNGSTRSAVVYQSRRQALIDLAQGVSRRDLRRCWAWRQLGLWKSSGRITETQATIELVRALCSEPEMIVPTLSALATSGELQNLGHWLTEQQWQSLAAAASEGKASRFFNHAGVMPSAAAMDEARRVISRSLVLCSMARSVRLSEAAEPMRRAIAVLAVLEVQPTLLQRQSAEMLIHVIANAIGKDESGDAVQAPETFETPESKLTNPHDLSENIRTEDSAPQINNDITANASSRETESTGRSYNQKDDRKPLDLRQRAFTRWGGLLFLLGVLEDLKLPEAILEHPLLGRRDFSWTLHQLALTLTGTDVHDPAALACAGLPPNAEPPSSTEEPVSENEAAALRQFTEVITERLRVLLEVEADVNLIDFVCRRRAQLVFDPGWIEVRLSIDDVSTEIRRAGLDLNPGYISWLGIVVSFVYE